MHQLERVKSQRTMQTFLTAPAPVLNQTPDLMLLGGQIQNVNYLPSGNLSLVYFSQEQQTFLNECNLQVRIRRSLRLRSLKTYTAYVNILPSILIYQVSFCDLFLM